VTQNEIQNTSTRQNELQLQQIHLLFIWQRYKKGKETKLEK